MMNTILVFFVLPIATIILSIVLQKILRNAFLTAATFFAIYLILAFTAFDESFLIFTIAYTIISFITAIIAEFFFERSRMKNCCNCRNCIYSNNSINTTNNPNATLNLTSTPSQTNANISNMNNVSNNSNWCYYRR